MESDPETVLSALEFENFSLKFESETIEINKEPK